MTTQTPPVPTVEQREMALAWALRHWPADETPLLIESMAALLASQAAAVRKAALEEAAVCAESKSRFNTRGKGHFVDEADICAAAIRALIDQPGETTP